MLEREVENAFVKAVRKQHGLCMKFTSPGLAGVPDRIVLLPKGHIAFVELKAPGKKLRPLQVKRCSQLKALGFPVLCIDKPEQIEAAIQTIRSWQTGAPCSESMGKYAQDKQTVMLPHVKKRDTAAVTEKRD